MLCFQLIRDGKVVALPEVDEEICKELKYKVHPDHYLFGWVDLVGLVLAGTGSYDKAKEHYSDDPVMMEIINYLEKNFQVKNWRE